MTKSDMGSASFYSKLPLRTDFGDVGRQECFAPLPDDWQS